MATSKRSASPSRPDTTSSVRRGQSPQPGQHSARQPLPPPPATGAIALPALLMVGADRVILDEEADEDDNLHFMAEYIDPA